MITTWEASGQGEGSMQNDVVPTVDSDSDDDSVKKLPPVQPTVHSTLVNWINDPQLPLINALVFCKEVRQRTC
jgi:hypothetical protein